MPETLRRGLAGQLVGTLRERVLTGEIPSGTRINEVEVARELGISRGPLREAIRQLVSEGLLVHVPNKGAVVFEAGPRRSRPCSSCGPRWRPPPRAWPPSGATARTSRPCAGRANSRGS